MTEFLKYLDTYTPQINIMIYGVDDDLLLLRLYEQRFTDAGLKNYKLFATGQEMIESLNGNVQIAIIDFNLGDMTGREVMDAVLKVQPTCKCIFVSAQENIDILIEINNMRALYVRKQGDFIEKLILHINTIAKEIEAQMKDFIKSAATVQSLIDAFEKFRERVIKNNSIETDKVNLIEANGKISG